MPVNGLLTQSPGHRIQVVLQDSKCGGVSSEYWELQVYQARGAEAWTAVCSRLGYRSTQDATQGPTRQACTEQPAGQGKM